MAKKNTGSLECRDGVYFTRASRQVSVPGQTKKVRQRAWVCLETGDFEVAKRKRARVLAALKSGAMPWPGDKANVATPVERSGVRFESFANQVTAKRRALGVAMVASEESNLELHICPANVGTDEAPVRFGDLLLADIGVRHVLRVLELTQAKGKSQGLVTHVRGVLSRVMQAAVLAELVTENVVRKVGVPKVYGELAVEKKRVVLTDGEIDTFFGCNDLDLEIRTLGLTSRVEGGSRTRDLTAWDWSMIDRATFSSCVIARTKTAAPQELPIPGVLQGPLRQWWTSEGCPSSGPVFPVTKGKRKGEARMARGVSFAKRLRRALMKAGVKRHRCEAPDRIPTKSTPCCRAFRTDPLYHETAWSLPVDFHSFRRAFKTALAAANVSSERAMILSGSSDPRAHARYIAATEEMLTIPDAALPKLGRVTRVARLDADLNPLGQDDPPQSASANGHGMATVADEADGSGEIRNDFRAGHEVRTRDPQLGKRSNSGNGPEIEVPHTAARGRRRPLITSAEHGRSTNGHAMATQDPRETPPVPGGTDGLLRWLATSLEWDSMEDLVLRLEELPVDDGPVPSLARPRTTGGDR